LARVLTDMSAIRWGAQGRVPPTFSDGVDLISHVPPPFSHYVFHLERFQNKSDVCRISCEELFMLDIIHSQVDVETEFGVVSVNVVFFWFR